MKINKKKFFQLHSWIGVKLSILFFLVCFSGTLATLSHEMDWLLMPEIRADPQENFASRNKIYDQFKKKYPDHKLTYWHRTREPYLCDILYASKNDYTKYIFANPYSGEIQGKANLTFQRFFRDFHYFLFIPFQVGHYIVLSFAFFLLASTITALFFYKNWYKRLFKLTLNKGSLALWRSFHRLIGIWTVPFTLLFSITGIWYFIERADVGNVNEHIRVQNPSIDSLFYNDYKGKKFNKPIDIDKAASIARNEIPGLVVEDVILPAKHGDPIYITGKSDVELVRSRANRVYLNPYNYEVLKVQKAKNLNWQTYVNDIADPLHFGYWGGLTTKIIWFFMGMGITSLVFSGLWIAIKRTLGKKRKKGVKHFKWLHLAVILLMLFFMYYILITQYHVTILQIVLITLFFLVLAYIGYYVFIKKMKSI